MRKFVALLLALLFCTGLLVGCGNSNSQNSEGSGNESNTEDGNLPNLSVGTVFTYGSYEQDNNLENGKEPIEWLVLDVQDGKALVISKYILEMRTFHKSGEAVTWESSMLRSWLNGEFLQNAFNTVEQTKLLTSEVNNPDLYPMVDSGRTTYDKLFLLSVEEATRYFSTDEARKCELTLYAQAKYSSGQTGDLAESWRLRTMSSAPYYSDYFYTASVGKSGYVANDIAHVSDGVRPAFWIDTTDGSDSASPVQSVKVGDTLKIGRYEQDNNISNGQESVEWQVLRIIDQKALLISKYGMDASVYHENRGASWENCTLREWLNSSFMNNCFSELEKTMLVDTAVTTPESRDTVDKLFVLLDEEVEEYFPGDADRVCRATAYAKANGATENGDVCCWWLRNSTPNYNKAGVVSENGECYSSGAFAEIDAYAVRPVCWIDLNEYERYDHESDSDHGNIDCETDRIPNIPSLSVGTIFTFGAYEQDNNASNGKKAVEWQVLAVENGRALVISKYALDSKPYHAFDERKDSIMWEWANCTLNRWLNTTFINSCFTASEKAKILTANIPTSYNPFHNTSTGSETTGKIFILSQEEARRYFSSDSAMKCTSTNYAVANGAPFEDANGNCSWWLRTSGDAKDYAMRVYGDYLDYDGDLKTSTSEGIRPAFWININS